MDDDGSSVALSDGFVVGFCDELAKHAGLTSTLRSLLSGPGRARSGLRGDPVTDPALAREMSQTFGTTPGATRDARGVVRIGGRKPQAHAGSGTAMLIGRPGSRFFRGHPGKMSSLLTGLNGFSWEFCRKNG